MQYDRRGSILADFEDAISDLVPHASPRRYESALANLGSYIGFDADRPEQIHGVGPDVLWRTDASYDFVIEAKSEKQEDNPLYKKDHVLSYWRPSTGSTAHILDAGPSACRRSPNRSRIRRRHQRELSRCV